MATNWSVIFNSLTIFLLLADTWLLSKRISDLEKEVDQLEDAVIDLGDRDEK